MRNYLYFKIYFTSEGAVFTMFYTINSSPMLVTKSVYKLIFVLCNYQTCTFHLISRNESHRFLEIVFSSLKKNISLPGNNCPFPQNYISFPGSIKPFPLILLSLHRFPLNRNIDHNRVYSRYQLKIY